MINSTVPSISGISFPTESFYPIPKDTKYTNAVTIDHFSILEISSRVSSSLSILSCATVIFLFLSWKRYRISASNRIIFFMLLSDLCSSIGWFLGRNSRDNQAMCAIQGMLIEFGDLSSVLWSAAMAFNLFMVLFMTKSARDLTQMEKYYFFLCFGIPLVLCLLLLFLQSFYGKKVFEDTSSLWLLWCWISSRELSWWIYFVPVWVVFVMNCFVYIISSCKVISKTKHMPWRLNTTTGDGYGSVVSGAGGSTVINGQRPGGFASVRYNNNNNTANTITTNTNNYNIHGSQASSVYSAGLSAYGSYNGISGGGAGMKSIVSLNNSSSTGTIVSLHTLLSFRRKYFVKITLFLLAFLLSFSVPTVTKLDNTNENTIYYIWAMAVFVPLRGLINVLCYFIPSLLTCIEERKRDLVKQNGVQ